MTERKFEITIRADRNPDDLDMWTDVEMEASGFDYREDIAALLQLVSANLDKAHKVGGEE